MSCLDPVVAMQREVDQIWADMLHFDELWGSVRKNEQPHLKAHWWRLHCAAHDSYSDAVMGVMAADTKSPAGLAIQARHLITYIDGESGGEGVVAIAVATRIAEFLESLSEQQSVQDSS